jgi:hypothetical protein
MKQAEQELKTKQLEAQRLTKEEEERQKLAQEREEIRQIKEELKRQGEELAAQKRAQELNEEAKRLEWDRIAQELTQDTEQIIKKSFLEFGKKLEKVAEPLRKFEQEQVKQKEELKAENPSKKSFEKSQRDKIGDFLSSSQDVSEKISLDAMGIVKGWTSTNRDLIEILRNLNDPVLNAFLSEEVEIAGDDSSL